MPTLIPETTPIVYIPYTRSTRTLQEVSIRYILEVVRPKVLVEHCLGHGHGPPT